MANKPLQNFKARIRQLSRRSGGCSLEQVVEKLRRYMLGWKGYFELAQTPKVWRKLDEGLGQRPRAIQLKQWKRPRASVHTPAFAEKPLCWQASRSLASQHCSKLP